VTVFSRRWLADVDGNCGSSGWLSSEGVQQQPCLPRRAAATQRGSSGMDITLWLAAANLQWRGAQAICPAAGVV